MWTVTVYLFVMAAFLWVQPSIAFGREGRIRPFGTSDREATVFPVWWWVFVSAALSYFVVALIAGSRG
jgi:hypothetical protein